MLLVRLGFKMVDWEYVFIYNFCCFKFYKLLEGVVCIYVYVCMCMVWKIGKWVFSKFRNCK